MSVYDDPNSMSEMAVLVESMVKEEVAASRERRSAHRVPFVRPVIVQLDGEPQPLYSFSKNVSSCGIGLIIRITPPSGTGAKLSIERLQGKPTIVRAEVRWAEPFGDGWYLTGWKFLSEIRR
jgi:hypothetical protein